MPLAGEVLVCVCVCVCVCCIYEGVSTHSTEWAAAVRTCVHRLATVFTVSNELMSLMEGLSEAASFHCVSQPSVGVWGYSVIKGLRRWQEKKILWLIFPHGTIIKSSCSLPANSGSKTSETRLNKCRSFHASSLSRSACVSVYSRWVRSQKSLCTHDIMSM